MPAAAELDAYAEAVVRRAADLPERRRALVAEVGVEGARQAAATVAAFSGLVRVADGTGIPIDDGLAAGSVSIRAELGLGQFAGAANSPRADAATMDVTSIESLFS